MLTLVVCSDLESSTDHKAKALKNRWNKFILEPTGRWSQSCQTGAVLHQCYGPMEQTWRSLPPPDLGKDNRLSCFSKYLSLVKVSLWNEAEGLKMANHTQSDRRVSDGTQTGLIHPCNKNTCAASLWSLTDTLAACSSRATNNARVLKGLCPAALLLLAFWYINVITPLHLSVVLLVIKEFEQSLSSALHWSFLKWRLSESSAECLQSG